MAAAGDVTPEAAKQSIEKQSKNDNHARDSATPSTIQDHDHEKLAQPKPFGSDAPDGGAVAWLVVLGTWCTSFCSFGWLNSMNL